MKIKRDFTDKRKILGCIIPLTIAVGILAAIAWGGFTVIRLVWRWLGEVVYTVSAMDTVIIIALISGVITIFGLIVNSILSMHIKNSDARYKRKVMLLKKLEAPYTQFVDMLFEMVEKKEDAEKIDEEIRTQLIRDMSREIILYGSDKIVSKWAAYRKNAHKFSIKEHLWYVEGILHLIREDMGIKKGALMDGELLSLFVSDMDSIKSSGYHIKIGKHSFRWGDKNAQFFDDSELESECINIEDDIKTDNKSQNS